MSGATVPLVPGMRRPYVAADLAPLPEGWQAGPPDFVAIGCGRAGSSWWWSLLQQHPAIVRSRIGGKELHFFQHFGWDGPDPASIALYREAFATPPGAICGDGSFNYLTHPMAVDHLWQAAPDTKLIAIVRNPVDRFISVYDRFLRIRLEWLGLRDERAHVQRMYSLWCEAVTHCRLADGIRAVQRRWDPSRVLVLQYEQCRRDPLPQLARTFEFLGVDASFAPADVARPVNREDHVVAEPDAAGRARIAELFADDVEQTVRLWPQIDPSLWKDFRKD